MSIICEDVKNCSPTTHYKGRTTFVHVSPVELPSIGVKWQTKPCFLPATYKRFAQQVADFEVRSDDVWVVSFPKCGTTWTQEMVWLIHNNLDYAAAEKTYLTDRFVFLEAVGLFDNKSDANIDENDFSSSSIERARLLPSPRFIKSHLPAQLLPTQIWTVRPKLIYTARNPKDAAVSFYHHYRNIRGYTGTFDQFMEAFLAEQVTCHILNFWNIRNEKNILFLTYEDMKLNLMAVLRTVTKFLGKMYNDAELEKLHKSLQVEEMRSRTATNGENLIQDISNMIGVKKQDESFQFIRKGESGSYKAEMTPELVDRFDPQGIGQFRFSFQNVMRFLKLCFNLLRLNMKSQNMYSICLSVWVEYI